MKTLSSFSLTLALFALFTGTVKGQVTSFTGKVITDTLSRPGSVTVADLNNDGYADIVASYSPVHKFVWYENNGNNNYTYHLISDTATFARSVFAANVNGDGYMDLAATYNDRVVWFENNGNETFTEHIVSVTAFQAREVVAIDMNTDGYMDLISASFTDAKFAWYKNDGSQVFTEFNISDTTYAASSIFPIDLDNDTDLDVAANTYKGIIWFENDGAENFTYHSLKQGLFGGTSVYGKDVDGDGDNDILAAYANSAVWFKNNGNKTFTEQVISSTLFTISDIFVADLDRDKDIDVLTSAQNGTTNPFAWFENNGSEVFTERILSDSSRQAATIYAADLDGDYDMDILTGELLELTWYKNNLPPCTSSVEINHAYNLCQGETLYAGGAYQSTSGTYLDVYGCDSVVITNLTFMDCPVTSQEKMRSISLRVYPVPTSGLLNMELQGFSHYLLYDYSGKLRMRGSETQIDLSVLNDGMYYLKVYDKLGIMETRKVILKR
jgi:hypothetical protein